MLSEERESEIPRLRSEWQNYRENLRSNPILFSVERGRKTLRS